MKQNVWLKKLEITINFFVSFLCFACCTLYFILFYLFSCTHISMYHAFFHTLRNYWDDLNMWTRLYNFIKIFLYLSYTLQIARCTFIFGIIIRNERCEAVEATSKSIMGPLEPTTGEAIDLVHAAAMCRDGGIKNIILEGDAKQMMDELNSNGSKWCKFGKLIDDTRYIL